LIQAGPHDDNKAWPWGWNCQRIYGQWQEQRSVLEFTQGWKIVDYDTSRQGALSGLSRASRPSPTGAQGRGLDPLAKPDSPLGSGRKASQGSIHRTECAVFSLGKPTSVSVRAKNLITLSSHWETQICGQKRKPWQHQKAHPV